MSSALHSHEPTALTHLSLPAILLASQELALFPDLVRWAHDGFTAPFEPDQVFQVIGFVSLVQSSPDEAAVEAADELWLLMLDLFMQEHAMIEYLKDDATTTVDSTTDSSETLSVTSYPSTPSSSRNMSSSNRPQAYYSGDYEPPASSAVDNLLDEIHVLRYRVASLEDWMYWAERRVRDLRILEELGGGEGPSSESVEDADERIYIIEVSPEGSTQWSPSQSVLYPSDPYVGVAL